MADDSRRIVDNLSSVIKNRREFADTKSFFQIDFVVGVLPQCHSLRHRTKCRRSFLSLELRSGLFRP